MMSYIRKTKATHIIKFFKNNATVGRKVQDLYNNFKCQYGDKLTHEEFEQALFKLKKKCILELKKKCSQYIGTNGPDSYDKFIKEEEYVSKNLWNKIFVEKEHVSKQPMLIEDDSPESDTNDKYFKLLPVNWMTMDFSARIDFTKKVQHVGFFNYILDGDKKLKNYFARMDFAGPERPKLYVTIFSIPAHSYSEEAKSLLRTFVNSLNMTGRAKLQYVQCSEPDMIEIREVR